METIEKIQAYVDALETRIFYRYLAIIAAILMALASFMVVHYYRSTKGLLAEIESVNDERERTQKVLSAFAQVKQQRQEVDAILDENKNFKIGGYFNALLDSLQLADKKTMAEPSRSSSREAHYQESILKVRFAGMNMKQLCELLNQIEQNRRVYSKELEIIKSKKTPKAIDVNLTVATLERKSPTG